MIKRFFNKIFSGKSVFTPPPDPDESKTIVDLGDGFEARKLVDGQWVIWCKSKEGAFDFFAWKNYHRNYFWEPKNYYWKDCKVSLSNIKSNIHQIKEDINKSKKIFASELLD